MSTFSASRIPTPRSTFIASSRKQTAAPLMKHTISLMSWQESQIPPLIPYRWLKYVHTSFVLAISSSSASNWVVEVEATLRLCRLFGGLIGNKKLNNVYTVNLFSTPTLKYLASVAHSLLSDSIYGYLHV